MHARVSVFALVRHVMISALPLLLVAAIGRADAQGIDFNRDIRPILSENCFYCHGPDKNRR